MPRQPDAVLHRTRSHRAADSSATRRSEILVRRRPAARTSVEAERRHRQERLAGAFRLFARFGFAQGLAGHITARDPELTDHFWVNPLGMHFSRINVSDLLLVNAEGETVIGERPLNKAAFAIHAAIHEHNPKIIAAAHTHSIYGKAWSTLGRKLDPLTQDSCAFHDDHALFDDFTGMVVDDRAKARASRRRWATARALILKNHGILTRRPERRSGGLVVHRARQRLPHATAGRSRRHAAADSTSSRARTRTSRSAARAARCMPSRACYEGLVEAEPDVLT